MKGLFLLPVFLPVLVGTFLVISSFVEHRKVTLLSGGRNNMPEEGNLTGLHTLVGLVMGVCIASVLYFAWNGEQEIVLFHFMDNLPIYFHVDELGRLFVSMLSLVWTMAGIYAFTYMKHEGEEKRFFGFFMIVYSVLVLLFFAGNLITLYFFYEMMTLTSMPLVFHNGSREAIMASLKYLFYSMCGAYLALFGVFYLYHHVDSFTFKAGGVLFNDCGFHKETFLIAIFIMVIGFGAKAGMFPLHSWLPSAHPVAPSPASAFLSAMIVKCGVFAVIRTIYYIVGPSILRGTWVQYAWIALALITVFMGSLMAYLEPVLKKRLAYSTVSQVSYIMFGIFLLTDTGLTGALIHAVAHAVIKCGLFLSAGIFLYSYHKTRVEELKGIGKKEPVLMWCWTFFSLALVGIPPFSGFISKWYLAQGALQSDLGFLRYLGPVVLLLSALLTAGYLITITIDGFLPGDDYEESVRIHPITKQMMIPLLILAALSLLLGVIPNPLISLINGIVSTVM